MTDTELIDGIIAREGGFSNDASDRGGATKYGITAAELGLWRRLGRPATAAEVAAMPLEEAHAIYAARYLAPFAAVLFPELKAQLADYGVLSGVTTAIRALQEVLGVPVDGLFGDRTTRALMTQPLTLTNNALVAHRVKFFVAIVDSDPTQAKFLNGWTRRAVGFYLT